MVYYPLLSNAYGAALFAAQATLLESELRRGPSGAAKSTASQGPPPAATDEDTEATEALELPILPVLPVDCDAQPTVPADDDMETARTRPFRLDQIHL